MAGSSEAPFGAMLPRLETAVPGPASRALARRLAAVECRAIAHITDEGPIFWAEARGANVRDVDGNVYVDLTAGFAAAAAGHANPRVARAIGEEAARLPHALGDVHPAEIKVRLLERLAALAPGPLGVSILATSGSEAVEAALKTALLRTGRPGILAFTGAYHGLTYGALAATHRTEFRQPFETQLFPGVRFAPFPAARPGTGQEQEGDDGAAALAAVERELAAAESSPYPIGAVLVEPIQGRGGIRVPPPGFLAGLRALCDGRRTLLVLDEVYTGFGRTGRWFACEHEGVVPDVLVVGKALAGAVPLAAAIGTPDAMAGWPPSTGEAIHTSTFMGNPVACAAALAHLAEIEEQDLVARAAALGRWLRERLDTWPARFPAVAEVRGLGLLQGAELVEDRTTRRPATALAARIAGEALRRGVLVLTEGPHANVLAFTPPLTIEEHQLDHALDTLEALLAAG